MPRWTHQPSRKAALAQYSTNINNSHWEWSIFWGEKWLVYYLVESKFDLNIYPFLKKSKCTLFFKHTVTKVPSLCSVKTRPCLVRVLGLACYHIKQTKPIIHRGCSDRLDAPVILTFSEPWFSGYLVWQPPSLMHLLLFLRGPPWTLCMERVYLALSSLPSYTGKQLHSYFFSTVSFPWKTDWKITQQKDSAIF